MRYFLLLLFFCGFLNAYSQTDVRQEHLSYRIDPIWDLSQTNPLRLYKHSKTLVSLNFSEYTGGTFYLPSYYDGTDAQREPFTIFYDRTGTGPTVSLYKYPDAKVYQRFYKTGGGLGSDHRWGREVYLVFGTRVNGGEDYVQNRSLTPGPGSNYDCEVVFKYVTTLKHRRSGGINDIGFSEDPSNPGGFVEENYSSGTMTGDAFQIISQEAKFTNIDDEAMQLLFCRENRQINLYNYFTDQANVKFTITGNGVNLEGNNLNLNSLAAGDYALTASKDYANGSFTETITLRILNTPDATITKSIDGNTFCFGQNVVLTAPEGYTYRWSTGETSRQITASNSATYSVTVYNGVCETTSESITLTALPAPNTTISISSGSANNCEGDVVVLSVPNASQYQWLNEVNEEIGTTQVVNITKTGTYRVRVWGENGCDAISEPMTIVFRPNPRPTIVANGPLHFCEGGSITLVGKMPDGVNTTNLRWSNGQTGPSITVNESGVYSVVATNENGCTSQSESVEVQVSPNPVPEILVTGNLEFCQGQTVTLTAPAGMAYLWSNGETTNKITTDVPGEYTVTVTNTTGCQRTSDPVTVVVHPNVKPIIQAFTETQICEGETVTLQVSNAQAGVNYTWSNGAIGIQNTVAASGNYYVIAENQTGCSQSSDPIAVTVTPIQKPEVVASGVLEFCAGGSVILTVTNHGGADEIRWSNGEVGPSIEVTNTGNYVAYLRKGECERASEPVSVNVLSNPNPQIEALGETTICEGDRVLISIVNPVPGTVYTWNDGSQGYQIEARTSGQYYVVSTNELACSAISETIPVTVHPIPKPTISASGDVDICEGDSVILTINETADSYRWSNGATTRSIVVNAAAVYTAFIANDEGCERASDPVIVSVRENRPVTISIFGSTTFCEGDSVVLTVNQDGKYLWSNGSTERTITIRNSSNVNVKVTNAEGCESTSDNIQITVHPIPKPTIVTSGPMEFCQGESVTLRIQEEAQGYRWSNGSTEREITVNSSQTLTAYITNKEGCERASDPITILVHPNPKPVINVSGPTEFCESDSITLSVTPISGYTYTWSNGDSGFSTVVKASANVYVTSSTPNGCTNISEPIEITVFPLPKPTVTPSAALEFCEGDSVVLTIDQIAAGYRWSNGSSDRTITVKSSQMLTAYITNEQGCERASDIVQVRVTANPIPQITIVGSTTFCDGDSVRLVAPVSNAYLWSNGDTNREITVKNPGEYSVTVTNSAGCERTSIAVPVTVIPNDVPVISSDNGREVCEGDTVILTASEGKLYRWNTGETTRSIMVRQSGQYVVTVINENDCSRTSLPFTLTVHSPTALRRIPDQQTCINASIMQLDSINVNPLDGVYTGEGVTYNTFDPAQAGLGFHTLTYTYTNEHGCVSLVSFTIEVVPITELQPGDDLMVCINEGNVLLTGEGLPPGVIITGDGVQGSQFVPTEAGVGVHEIFYTYTNVTGCVSNAKRIITVTPVPDVPVVSGNNATCDDGTLILTARSRVLGNASIRYLWYKANEADPFYEGESLRYVVKGSETLYVEAVSGGCTSERTAVNVFSLTPVISFSASATNVIQGTPIDFILSEEPNSNPTARWEWDFGDGFSSSERNPRHYYNKPGVYDVRVRAYSEQGCMVEDKVEGLINVEKDPLVITPPTSPDTAVVDDRPYVKTVVYPNPITAGTATIRANNPNSGDQDAVLEIYTISGKLIASQQLRLSPGQNDLPIENLNRLVAHTYYLFVLRRGNGHETLKVLVL